MASTETTDDATIEGELRAAIDADDRERAAELAADLWNERDRSSVEVADAGDGGTVEVSKDGFLGFFDMAVDHRDGKPWASDVGHVAFERHDDDGYHLIEDVEVMASASTVDAMNDALSGVEAQYQERRARRKEHRNMVL